MIRYCGEDCRGSAGSAGVGVMLGTTSGTSGTSGPCARVQGSSMGCGASHQGRHLEVENPNPSHAAKTNKKYVYLDSCPAPLCDECSTPTEETCSGSCDYWEGRMQDQARAQAEIDRVMASEYKQAREEIDYRFRKYVGESGGPLPCAQASQEMLGCLKRCPARTLDCAPQLRSFSSCLDQYRMDKLSAEDECSRVSMD